MGIDAELELHQITIGFTDLVTEVSVFVLKSAHFCDEIFKEVSLGIAELLLAGKAGGGFANEGSRWCFFGKAGWRRLDLD